MAVDFLVDAGADTQVRNRNGDLPIDLIAKDDDDLRAILQKADLGKDDNTTRLGRCTDMDDTATTMADDVVDLDDVVDDDDVASESD